MRAGFDGDEMAQRMESVTRQEQFALTTSRQFESWLAEQELSLAFSTYQAGKIFFIGLGAEGRLSVFERTLDRCMALRAEGETLWVSTLYQLWRFDNVLKAGQDYHGHDRLFAPRRSWVTGDLDIHDVHLGAHGQPVFANTLFSCLATISEAHSFTPVWRPPFISKLAAEDRCHLNGFAMRGGEPAYATAVSMSDVADGWRDHRRSGGVLIDVTSGDVVAAQLSMPHSPRIYRDNVWFVNAGSGEFGRVSLATGAFEPIAFCPGYARGLSFHGDFALITLSLPRDNRTFSGLPLDDALSQRNAEPRCGLLIIDLNTGDAAHWLRIEGIVTELFDVAPLPGVRRPRAIGFKTDEIRRVISIG